ncbi:hypothetical protein [Haloarcula sp. CGMCC 1.6347]|uniref:hypothetical protein n=1 Tax=Haloarcula sp. CGMCC 1.6347 TaxID=3111455 RepID=UPI00300F5530
MRFQTLRYDFQQPEWLAVLSAVVLTSLVLAEVMSPPYSYIASVATTTLVFVVYRGAVGRPD